MDSTVIVIGAPFDGAIVVDGELKFGERHIAKGNIEPFRFHLLTDDPSYELLAIVMMVPLMLVTRQDNPYVGRRR